MNNQSRNNSRIAKNTLLLYFRMMLVMAVTLYTSRIVLQQLGIDDFGIYSIIGGIILLISFFNQSMSTSTQRYITYELGKKDGDVSKIFSICVRIHLWVAIGVLILAETLGLWFVNSKMSFPEGSMNAVNWTYQLSVISCIATIIRAPYNALVLAHERMSFYAYNSIVEVLLKLAIVFALIAIPDNKLIYYMLMLTVVTIMISIWYAIYCKRTFASVRLVKLSNKSNYKEIVAFSGWATFGSIANVGYQQGIAVIINLFYGVAANAAVGIANQVNGAITQFVSGFQQALNPQLIKSEASGDSDRQLKLICSSAKFSFLIMLLFANPLICNIDYILSLWLGNYPPNTGIISSLIILGALIETLSGPLWVTIFATGKIRIYQMVISTVLLLNLPLGYLLGYFGYPDWTIYIIRIALFIVALATRLLFLRKLISLNIPNFLKAVALPLTTICILLVLVYLLISNFSGNAESFIEFVVQTTVYFTTTLLLVISIGLSRTERYRITAVIKNKLKK